MLRSPLARPASAEKTNKALPDAATQQNNNNSVNINKNSCNPTQREINNIIDSSGRQRSFSLSDYPNKQISLSGSINAVSQLDPVVVSNDCTKNVSTLVDFPSVNTLQSNIQCNSPSPSVPTNNTQSITGNEVNMHARDNQEKGSAIQTGMDRYIVVKRKLSPQKTSLKSAKQIKTNNSAPETNPLSSNRFAPLANADDTSTQKVTKEVKPPPIYLRERNSTSLLNTLTSLIGAKNFHVVPILKGKIHETKIQIYSESSYRKVVELFDTHKKNYYTYQLKSSKGIVVVLRGIEANVDVKEIREALSQEGFATNSVYNIHNKDKNPMPLFRVELQPADSTLRKGESHPIYNLRYLLHRKISVEEPHKRIGPVQCLNCQEFGHTRKYCTLPSVCVVCGDLHESQNCTKPKDDSSVKKCSNCGENHTANYRGCSIYVHMKKKLAPQPKQVKTVPPATVLREFSANEPQPSNMSYANILKGSPSVNPKTDENTLEKTLQVFIANMTQFMCSMQSMMQDMIRNQNILLQSLLAKP